MMHCLNALLHVPNSVVCRGVYRLDLVGNLPSKTGWVQNEWAALRRAEMSRPAHMVSD